MLYKAWRVLYPLLLHLVISEVVAGLGLMVLTNLYGGGMSVYDQFAMLQIGIISLVAIAAALPFYKKDEWRRECGRTISSPPGMKITGKEAVLLLVMGAAFSQYGNYIAAVFQLLFPSTYYQNLMESVTAGKGILTLIFWMGIVSPIAEELIFRGLIYLRLRDYMRIGAAAILSGVIFGIYHGNLIQAIYAGLLGAGFAYILEMTGNLFSSMLLHIGANVWSLILSEYGYDLVRSWGYGWLLVIYAILLIALAVGVIYFREKGSRRGYRAI